MDNIRVRRNIYKLIGFAGMLALLLPGSLPPVAAQNGGQAAAESPAMSTNRIILHYRPTSLAFLSEAA